MSARLESWDTKLVILVIIGVAVTLPTTASADSVLVKVLDEQNKGIHSRVMYVEGSNRSVLGDTDPQGILSREYKCKDGQVMRARPFDIGTYFESREEPCASNLTLRVLKRQTPKGLAIQFRIEPITFKDGSAGVITYKAFLETAAADTTTAVSACEVKINTLVDQQVFRVDGLAWSPLKRGETDLSKIVTGAARPDSKAILLPYTCNTSGSRIQQLTTDTAKYVGSAFSTGEIRTEASMQMLGIQ